MASRPKYPTPPAWVRLVKEGAIAPQPTSKVREPQEVVDLLRPRCDAEEVECFYVLVLDSQSNVRAAIELTRGLLNSSLVHPREVFRTAILYGAAGIIVAHNHPSGDPTPSPEDRAVTRQLLEAGRLLGLPLYDHIILGADGRYLSFASAGLLT
jgi:DNA repair protein RadC